MREIEGWAAKGRSWRIAAPYGVFSSVWKEKGGAYAVQFLNGTGVRMKFGDPIPNESPDPAFPSVDEDIVITAPASAGNAAVAVSPDFPGECRLEVKDNADGTVAVTLPKGTLRAYVLVRLSVR